MFDKGVVFSLSFPYTFNKLNLFLKKIVQRGGTVERLGKTTLKNPIFLFKYEGLKNERNAKECIVILARQHSCETVGSFICEEIINELIRKKQKT